MDIKNLIVLLTIVVCIFTNNVAFADSTKLSPELKHLLSQYETAINAANYDYIVDHIPPTVFNEIADRAKQNTFTFYRTLSKELKEHATTFQTHNFHIDLDDVKDNIVINDNRFILAPINYQVVDSNNIDVTITAQLLGIELADKWYFVRIDDSYFMKFWRKHFPSVDKIEMDEPLARRTNEGLPE